MKNQSEMDGIVRLLEQLYGKKTVDVSGDPLSGLIATILSQNTSDTNSSRAFESLRKRFPSWEDVLAADIPDIAEAIRAGGLAEQKAPRIKEILQQIIDERGELSLDFLREMEDSDVEEYLLKLNGVGPKTAACVLMFELGRNVFPVDTHVERISKRLGLADLKASPKTVQNVLESITRPEIRKAAHVLFIRHGRSVCKAQKPVCGECPLRPFCWYYKSRNTLHNN